MFLKHSYAVFQCSCKHTTGSSPTFPPISQCLPPRCISNPVRVDVHQSLGKVRCTFASMSKLKNVEAINFQCFVGSFWVGMKVTFETTSAMSDSWISSFLLPTWFSFQHHDVWLVTQTGGVGTSRETVWHAPTVGRNWIFNLNFKC